jgi:hypothetical protein
MASTDLGGGRGYSQGQPAEQKSVADLAGDLAHEMTSLVHHEIALAKTELTQKGKAAGVGAGMFGAAGALAAFGLGCLTACAIAALQLGISVWLASLIVGVVYFALAGVLLLAGRSRVRQATPPLPAEAVQSTKEDVQWLKTQAKSAPR